MPDRDVPVNLNLSVRGMPHSATVAINERADRMRAQGRDVFKLGLGQSPFPVPAPVVEALRAAAHEKAYLPVAGLPELRAAVAGYHARSQHTELTDEGVLIGPGSKELMFLLQLVYYGDLVIPTPAWVSYAPQAQIVGRRVEWIHTSSANGWRMTAAQLEALCALDPGRPRVVILNYPSNPTGRTYSPAELQAIAEVAERYRVVLLSDEIYGELHHEGKHASIAAYYPQGTIISSGLSKWCGAGGWRLGTFSFPEPLAWLRDAMAAVASETFTSVSAPIQHAAVRAFVGGSEIDAYLVSSRRVLSALGQWCAAQLEAAGASVQPPEGGFYLFPDFLDLRERMFARGVTSCRDMVERLLTDTGVAVLPGGDFGCGPGEMTVRLAYVDFDGVAALQALDDRPETEPLGEDFLRRYCAGVTTAVDRWCDWLVG